jgi:hypothetical protein
MLRRTHYEGKIVHDIESVQSIVKVQRIPTFEIFFEYRVPQDAHTFHVVDDFLTLVVTTDTTLSNSLVRTIIQIRQSLKNFEATKDIFIEVIDYRALYNLYTSSRYALLKMQ